MTNPASAPLQPTTLSRELLADWLTSVAAIAGTARLDEFLQAAGIAPAMLSRPGARITDDQAISFYQIAAVRTGDEMMGLWSRPIRSGALKFISRSIIGAPTMATALNRFTQVWNLLLDDYQLAFVEQGDRGGVSLSPRGSDALLNRFGHVLMLKLVHGVISWLSGREVTLAALELCFSRPSFSRDYSIMFPSQPAFDAAHSMILFSRETLALPIIRTESDVRTFLERAPRDWLFTASIEHALALRIRQQIYRGPASFRTSLAEAAKHLGISERSLTRQLAVENDSFQQIKDRLRR